MKFVAYGNHLRICLQTLARSKGSIPKHPNINSNYLVDIKVPDAAERKGSLSFILWQHGTFYRHPLQGRTIPFLSATPVKLLQRMALLLWLRQNAVMVQRLT